MKNPNVLKGSFVNVGELLTYYLSTIKIKSCLKHKVSIVLILGIYKVPSVLCLPCERPEMVVSRDSEVIGYLKQPFMCCGRSEYIYHKYLKMSNTNS